MLTGDTPLKGISPLQKPSIVNSTLVIGRSSWAPLFSHVRTLAHSIFRRSCTGSHICCEFMNPTVLPCPEDIALACPLPEFWLLHLSAISSKRDPELLGGVWWSWMLLPWHLLSAIWLVVSFCVNHHPVHKVISQEALRAGLICKYRGGRFRLYQFSRLVVIWFLPWDLWVTDSWSDKNHELPVVGLSLESIGKWLVTSPHSCHYCLCGSILLSHSSLRFSAKTTDCCPSSAWIVASGTVKASFIVSTNLISTCPVTKVCGIFNHRF